MNRAQHLEAIQEGSLTQAKREGGSLVLHFLLKAQMAAQRLTVQIKESFLISNDVLS